jgi:hypothetical protein
LDSRCERFPDRCSRSRALATEFASARTERPSAAHDHPQIRGKQTQLTRF